MSANTLVTMFILGLFAVIALRVAPIIGTVGRPIMKYFTLIRFDFSHSKEGAQRYMRIEGKIPLWRSDKAARVYRTERNMSKWDNFVHTVELDKLRRDHILMPEHKAGSSECPCSPCDACDNEVKQ